MSECIKGDKCTCTTPGAGSDKEEVCKCDDGYIARDNKCRSKDCYDPLTDTFCGNYFSVSCDNNANKCNCDTSPLELIFYKGRCITKTCLTGQTYDDDDTADKIECWGRGYCAMSLAGGSCTCFPAYKNTTGCTECDPENAIEKTTKSGKECIPKACMDKLEPNVDLVCNNLGECAPHIAHNPNGADLVSYVCKCTKGANRVGNNCYPDECVISDQAVSNTLTVCNSKGTCNLTSKKCECKNPYNGTFCRSCLPEYEPSYIYKDGAITFTCIHDNCWDYELMISCSNHGTCDTETNKSNPQCICDSGYTLKAETGNTCIPCALHKRAIQANLLLAYVLAIILFGLGVLGAGIYLTTHVILEHKKKREYKEFVQKEKIRIAKDLSKTVPANKQISMESSVLTTAEYVAHQRRYV